MTEGKCVKKTLPIKTEKKDWPIKGIMFVEYSLGGGAAYLQWVASISAHIEPPSTDSEPFSFRFLQTHADSGGTYEN